MKAMLLVMVAAAACSSDTTPPQTDAAGSGSNSGSAAFGAACTTASDTSTECASGVCTDSFNQTTPLCSQKCTLLMMTDPSCPAGSQGQKCNMKGYCRP